MKKIKLSHKKVKQLVYILFASKTSILIQENNNKVARSLLDTLVGTTKLTKSKDNSEKNVSTTTTNPSNFLIRCTILLLLMPGVLALGFVVPQAMADHYDDDGLIEITTTQQLDAIRWDIHADGMSSNDEYTNAFPDTPINHCPDSKCKGYKLMNHLVINDDFSMVDEPFHAILDGNNYQISNITINDQTSSGDVGGIFSVLRGDVYNLNLVNVNVTTNGASSTGGLVGKLAGGNITNVSVTGNINSTYENTGGVVGFSQGHISESHFSGNVTGSDIYTGGLIGYATDPNNSGYAISKSYSIVNITSTGSSTGGLVGRSAVPITESYSIGIITNTGSSTGGLVGESAAPISKSYFIGNITGSEFSTGGLVG